MDYLLNVIFQRKEEHMTTITIHIPKKIKIRLERLSKQQRRKESTIIRTALERYLSRLEFRAIREELVPEAQKRGIYTDEDVFKLIS